MATEVVENMVHIPAKLYQLRDVADRLSEGDRKFVLEIVGQHEKGEAMSWGEVLHIMDMAVPT